MQNMVTINNIPIPPPDEGLGCDFETKFSSETARSQSGVLHSTPLFTVESFTYTATDLTAVEVKTILQQIARGDFFTLHYFSPYYGAWRDDTFYVGKGTLSIGRLNEAKERFERISFNMIGVNPI